LPGGITVIADPAKIGWVAVSLMGNALRYSPSGGTIGVQLSVVADHAELRVSDQGPGLHPSIRDRIFERRDGHGLFLAREIVEAHGGSIRVRSQVGRGCAFTFTLPIARGGRAQP
jgi:signal transduction histidine kinase